MQVNVEIGEGLARQMTVELPAEDVEREIDKRLQDLARNARIPGFRPGKVPLRVLRQRYTEGVRGEVIGELFQQTYPKALEQQDLKPAGMPDVEPRIDAAERRYAYVAKFEVMPEVEFKDLAGKTVERPVVELNDQDIDQMIERLQEQRKEWAPVKRKAKKGDRMKIDFVGTMDGVAFEGGSAEGVDLELGSGTMIPGFEQALIGAKAGEEVEFDVDFPEDYGKAELAGKPAHFKVQVQEVIGAKLPAVDAEFIKAFGVESGEEPDFREELRTNMERERKQRVQSLTKNRVMDLLIKANEVTLPEALVKEEIQSMKQQMTQSMGGGQFELPDGLFTEPAQRRVALGLILAEAVKKLNIEIDEDRVRAQVEEMAATYETPQEVIDYYYADQQRLGHVRSLVLEEMVVERLLEDAEVKDESMSFADLTSDANATK